MPRPARCGAAVHKGFGVKKIGIHQAGEKHPRKERSGEIVLAFGDPGGKRWAGRDGRQAARHRNLPLDAPEEGGLVRCILAMAAVGNAAVVPGNGKSSAGVVLLQSRLCPGRGMIHRRAAVQAVLKAWTVLSQVVEKPDKFPLGPGAESGGKLPGQGGGSAQVVGQRLAAGFVFADVGKWNWISSLHGKLLSHYKWEAGDLFWADFGASIKKIFAVWAA